MSLSSCLIFIFYFLKEIENILNRSRERSKKWPKIQSFDIFVFTQATTASNPIFSKLLITPTTARNLLRKVLNAPWLARRDLSLSSKAPSNLCQSNVRPTVGRFTNLISTVSHVSWFQNILGMFLDSNVATPNVLPPNQYTLQWRTARRVFWKQKKDWSMIARLRVLWVPSAWSRVSQATFPGTAIRIFEKSRT